MGEATGMFVSNPNTTVAQAQSAFQQYVTNQFGSTAVTTLK
jgi:hypothetical protein